MNRTMFLMFVLMMWGCTNKGTHEGDQPEMVPKSSTITDVGAKGQPNIHPPIRIGGINLDTLILKSRVISRQIDEIQSEYVRLQRKLQDKYNKFKEDLEDYRNRYESMSRSEILITESKLKKQQEELIQLENQYSEYLANLQAKKQETASRYLRKAVDSIARKYNLSMVVTYGTGSPIVFIADTLDYTMEAISIIDESKKDK